MSMRAYLLTQLKRMLRAFPAVFGTTVLLLTGAALLVGAIFKSNAEDDTKKKVEIGLVGDLSGSYLGIGIEVLKNLDSSRFFIDFLEMDEEEAKERLAKGELSAYAVVPDGFVDSVMVGDNLQIAYVTGTGVSNLITGVMNEVAETISLLLTESQSAIYGMQDMLVDYGKTDKFWTYTDDLYLRFIAFIVDRTDAYEVEELGISRELSYAGYYACGIFVLFLLMWGITCSGLLVRKNEALQKLLAAKGQNGLSQVICEYTAYLSMMLLNITAVMVIIMVCMDKFGVSIPEWNKSDATVVLGFALRMLPVFVMIAALQFVLYELTADMVSALLVQFLCAVGLGYLSGCFYPASFFPKGVQILAEWLPSGAALKYADGLLLDEVYGGSLGLVCVYAVLFVALAVWVRYRKLQKV